MNFDRLPHKTANNSNSSKVGMKICKYKFTRVLLFGRRREETAYIPTKNHWHMEVPYYKTGHGKFNNLPLILNKFTHMGLHLHIVYSLYLVGGCILWPNFIHSYSNFIVDVFRYENFNYFEKNNTKLTKKTCLKI